MTRKDNVVDLAATHLHQSAIRPITENKIGEQPVAAVAEVASSAGKEKQINVKETDF
jgi:hypothetical protein